LILKENVVNLLDFLMGFYVIQIINKNGKNFNSTIFINYLILFSNEKTFYNFISFVLRYNDERAK